MEWEIFDIDSFLKKELKISIQDFCNKLSISVEEEQMWETNCRIPSEVLEKIKKVFKKSYNQLSNYMNVPPPIFTVNDYWEANRQNKIQLKNFANSIGKGSQQFQNEANRLTEMFESLWRKPRVGFIGGSDSGKSTLINILLGNDCLPASYSPLTSVPIFLKHTEDRPAYMNEEVWIMKAGRNDEMWDDRRLSDEEYTRSFFYKEGSYSLLEKYCTFHNDMVQDEQAICAVAFVKSDILKNCDLVDTPGLFSGGMIKEKSGMDFWGNLTDILVYTSAASRFMWDLELNYLSNYLQSIPVYEKMGENTCPRLCNFYVLATRAAEVKEDSVKQLKVIRTSFVGRFYRVIDKEGFWAARSAQSGYLYTQEDFANRVFFFDRDIADFHTAFYTDLKMLLNNLAHFIDHYSRNAIMAVAGSIFTQQEQALRQWNSNLIQVDKHYKELQVQLTGTEYAIGRKKLKEEISKKVSDQADVFEFGVKKLYEDYFTVENIGRIWKEKQFEETREGINDLFTHLLASFTETVTERMRKNVESVSDECIRRLDSFYGKIKEEFSMGNKTQGIDYMLVARELQKEEKGGGVPSFPGGASGIIMMGINKISISMPVLFVSALILALVVDFLQDYYKRKKVAERFITLLEEKRYLETIQREAGKNWKNMSKNLEEIDEACHKQVLNCQAQLREVISVVEKDRQIASQRIEELQEVCGELEGFIAWAGKGEDTIG